MVCAERTSKSLRQNCQLFFMEMSSLRPESHVAQQMRRDKLRIQQVYNMEQLSVHNVQNNNANLLYDPALVTTSEMLNYSANSNSLFPHKDQESGAEYDFAIANLSHPIFSNYNTKVTRDVQNSGVWRSIGSSSANHVIGSQPYGQNRVIGDEDQTIGTTSKAYGNYNTTGPLGPFTGYATILKSSKYLTPAQMLLDQTCKAEIISGDCRSAPFYGSNEMSGEFGVGMSSSDSHRPDFQQKKAKLMFMHEEICRRYKQYHQQIQMVVSSFETVAGLSGSTPYISFALKTVAKHFRHLKNAISNHLSDTDFSSPITGTSSCGKLSDHNKLKFMEQAGGYFHKQHKSNVDQGNVIGLLDPHQQEVWRPQRGLPDRAVSVLRAWLFDHFLHPYPTDTDKHMLANQTGLTRNQVSNWFINARVRVWKPMVEEIHMLETQGMAETNINPSKNDGLTFTGNTDRPKNDQQWSQDKRSRIDDNIPVGVALDGGSYMGSVVPYHRNALEYGGLGSVSLTLGLRQNVESAAQQQQLRQRERQQAMQHFGGHMVHDFVG